MSALREHIGKVIANSEIIAEVSKVKKPRGKSVLFGNKVRPLKDVEIEALIANGNYSPNWRRIMVAPGFSPDTIYGSNFFGKCVLSCADSELLVDKNLTYFAGIYDSTLHDCEVGRNVLIKKVGTISNYIIKEGAVVFNCASIIGGETTFGNGVEMNVVIETGGRELKSYAEMTIPVAELVCGRRGDKELQKEYADFIAKYFKAVKSPKGIICEKAIVRNMPKVIDSFIGKSAVIDAATLVSESTILSNDEEKTEVVDGAFVRKSILQWGCEVATMAIVDKSVLTEHSHAERHGKVTESILGPNTGVAEGECTASLCGPFVGFHHQALLIAAYWPEGKGNVGYGANVGSNHTGKAPDQEIWCGEGTFFGLGVNIKMPTDFSHAPYSIIATAVNALGQKVEMPFSLINTPADRLEGISPAYNEIMPGWVLSDNIFSIKRNEGKYIKRNKAKRTQFVFEVFRPDIVDMMIEARKRLSAVKEVKLYYTDKDIHGIGKNYMSEASRKNGIEAYTYYIRYYALKGLKKKAEKIIASGKVDMVPKALNTKTTDARWEHERGIILLEFKDADVKSLLSAYACMCVTIARDVEESKAKDDRRGVRVIPDYAEAHEAAKDNAFVKETLAEAEKIRNEVQNLIAKLK